MVVVVVMVVVMVSGLWTTTVWWTVVDCVDCDWTVKLNYGRTTQFKEYLL